MIKGQKPKQVLTRQKGRLEFNNEVKEKSAMSKQRWNMNGPRKSEN